MTANASLLELPAELRNQIYREAVVIPDGVHIDLSDMNGPNTKQPALLHACRQIRAEAITLYYLENKFHITIPSEDGKRMLPFYRAAENHVTPCLISVCCGWKGAYSWTNLLAWLKLYHARDIRLRPVYAREYLEAAGNDLDRSARVVEMAFKTVEEMLWVKWDMVAAVLEKFHLVVAGFDRDWA